MTSQFPDWKDLPIKPVTFSGWDNRTFHLGSSMLVRMPSAAEYALQVEKEQLWLPRLAPLLPLRIPEPIAIGSPEYGYPWKWSIYRWIEGQSSAHGQINDLCDFARTLATFLLALQTIDTTGGPLPGPHSFYRGGDLTIYDGEVRQALTVLKDKIDVKTATDIWDKALLTKWEKPPVWVHGDLSVGNLLVQKGRLSAVIDFGQLTIGDPACDLAIAWTLFTGDSRRVFRSMLPIDVGTWTRGRAWTLWKALIVAARITDSNNTEAMQCFRVIDVVFEDYKTDL